MGRTPDDVIVRLTSACADGARLVRLAGPLGAGKTRALAAAAASGWGGHPPDLVLDGIDQPHAIAHAQRRMRPLPPDALVVLAGRRVAGVQDPAAPGRPAVTVPVPPWPAGAIAALAAAAGLTGAEIEPVVTLAAGVPLIAQSVAAAIVAGTAPDALGALADAATREVLRRLAAEDRHDPDRMLPVVALAGPMDEELLAALVDPPAGAFDRLAALSLVTPGRHGIAVDEPFRTLFDLAFAWRHPIRHRHLRARGTAYRCATVTAADDPAARADLVDEVLCTTTDAEVRRTFFPVPRPPLAHDTRIRPAGAADGDAVERLMHDWSRHEGLSRRSVERMLRLWMDQPVSGFDLLVDGDDRPLGMANLTGIGAGSRPVLEPLLQQYSDTLIAPEADGYPARGGAVIGMMVVQGDHAFLRAPLLRHIVRTGVAAQRIVVSTTWGPYQELATRIGLASLGHTRADAYGCGRTSGVFVKSFETAALPSWLRSLSPGRMMVPRTAPITVADVQRALEHIHDPARLAVSPLLGATTLGSARELADFLRAEIAALTGSDRAEDADAGRVLAAGYLHRGGGTDAVAHRLHLSRATYFRRRNRGLARLAEAAGWLAAFEPGPTA